MAADVPDRFEKLAPFALRARVLVVGRERLTRMRKRLAFVIMTRDLADNSRREMLRRLEGVQVVHALTAPDLERLFGLGNTKVVGFSRSTLATSLLRALREAEISAPGEGPAEAG